MKNVVLFASIVLTGGLLFTNIYNSIVDAAAWGSNIPRSVEVTRQYYQTVNPGSFYRVFSPLNQLLALAVVILFWKSAHPLRYFLCLTLICYVLTDALTFGYFYPRNEIIMTAEVSNVAALQSAWSEWSTMNWVRSLLLLVGLISSCWSLHKIYTPR